MGTGNTDSYRCLRDDPCYGCRHSVPKMGRTAAFERQLECFRTGERTPCLGMSVLCCYEGKKKKRHG